MVDDLLATGGTAAATAGLVEQLRAQVQSMLFLIELRGLGGREALAAYDVHAVLDFDIGKEGA